MPSRKHRTIARTRTVVVYRNGAVGYYSRDRVEGGMSPVYPSEAMLAAARSARSEAGASGAKPRWSPVAG